MERRTIIDLGSNRSGFAELPSVSFSRLPVFDRSPVHAILLCTRESPSDFLVNICEFSYSFRLSLPFPSNRYQTTARDLCTYIFRILSLDRLSPQQRPQ